MLALAIQTGTIWPLIIAHFGTNFAGLLAAGRTGAEGAVTTQDMAFAYADFYLLVGNLGAIGRLFPTKPSLAQLRHVCKRWNDCCTRLMNPIATP